LVSLYEQEKVGSLLGGPYNIAALRYEKAGRKGDALQWSMKSAEEYLARIRKYGKRALLVIKTLQMNRFA